MRLDAVEELARDLMQQHGVADGFGFEFDNGKRRAGACHWRRAGLPGKGAPIVPWKITLSRHIMVLWDEEHVRATILHEIAHALAGHAESHGPRFRQIARDLGTDGTRCYSADLPTPPAPLVAVCPVGHSREAFKRPSRGRMKSCGVCSPGKFDERYVLTYKRNPAASSRPVQAPVQVAASTPPPPKLAPLTGPAGVPSSRQGSLF